MFQLPALPYDQSALEPYIDTETVTIHYLKHHQNYCSNLNKTLENHLEYSGMAIDQIIRNIETIPVEIRQAVINNGGGFYNHNLYWENIMPDARKEPDGLLMDEITKAFVSFADFQKLFTDSAVKLFGSGWTWLVQTKTGELKIVNTANQDCPLSMGLRPLLALDVWEHAYYLKYQNRRAEYIANWWNVVNWKVAAVRLETPLG